MNPCRIELVAVRDLTHSPPQGKEANPCLVFSNSPGWPKVIPQGEADYMSTNNLNK